MHIATEIDCSSSGKGYYIVMILQDKENEEVQEEEDHDVFLSLTSCCYFLNSMSVEIYLSVACLAIRNLFILAAPTRYRVQMECEEILNGYVDLIDNEIKLAFEEYAFPGKLYGMMQYHLGWLDEKLEKVERYRGKRFRPTMCLLTYKALSGVIEKALPAAAAIELVHNFSLIHDDIQDRDETRRHRPTVWKLWGEAQAINAGDGMHALANIAALRMRKRNVTDSSALDVLEILNSTIIKLCEGQFLDMSYEENLNVTPEMYLEMIYRKTGALIEASTGIGAMLGTVDVKKIEHFSNFGSRIGTAFQIRDDIIGIWEEETGKPKASDIRNRKKTLPILYAFEKEGSGELKDMYSGRKKLNEREVDRVLDLLEDVKAHQYAQKVAKKYEEEALSELKKTKVKNEAINCLNTIALFLVRRRY